jgi:hypothetical protein
VQARGGGAANEQGHFHAALLHLLRPRTPFIERGRDETGEADDIHVCFTARRECVSSGTITPRSTMSKLLQASTTAHDVLADVVHVAFHRWPSRILPGRLALLAALVGQQEGL